MSKFDPLVVIETERLKLRFLNSSDKHAIFVNINHDQDVLRYFLDSYLDKEEDMILDKRIDFCLLNERYFLAIELKETNEVIGMILQCSTPTPNCNASEIGFAIGKKYWNKGYTTEAFKAFMEYLFDGGIHKLIAAHLSPNLASKKVIEKCGMHYEGRRIDDIYYHDQYYDVDYYYLLSDKQIGE